MNSELPHEQKQWYHRQVVIRETSVRELVEGEQQGIGVAIVNDQVAQNAADEHADTDMHSQCQQAQYHDKGQYADRDATHMPTSPSVSSLTSVSSDRAQLARSRAHTTSSARLGTIKLCGIHSGTASMVEVEW